MEKHLKGMGEDISHTTIHKYLRNDKKNGDLSKGKILHFQQDGTPPYTAIRTQK